MLSYGVALQLSQAVGIWRKLGVLQSKYDRIPYLCALCSHSRGKIQMHDLTFLQCVYQCVNVNNSEIPGTIESLSIASIGTLLRMHDPMPIDADLCSRPFLEVIPAHALEASWHAKPRQVAVAAVEAVDMESVPNPGCHCHFTAPACSPCRIFES
jgi:hypothetical protein